MITIPLYNVGIDCQTVVLWEIFRPEMIVHFLVTCNRGLESLPSGIV